MGLTVDEGEESRIDDPNEGRRHWVRLWEANLADERRQTLGLEISAIRGPLGRRRGRRRGDELGDGQVGVESTQLDDPREHVVTAALLGTRSTLSETASTEEGGRDAQDRSSIHKQ
jgi:hypothetical protein